MLKAIRCLLYGLAVSAGVAGLFAGGVPLVKYAVFKWFHGRDSDYYDDPNYLFSPEVVFLLSWILLIFVRISLVLEKGFHPSSLPQPDASGKAAENPPAPASTMSRPARAAAANVPTDQAAADEKLARLLNQKNL
jgi:hypothetical protein